jgi:CHAD domain-containing protein
VSRLTGGPSGYSEDVAPGTRSLEREVKFDTTMAFRLPDLRRVVGATVRKPSQELRTAYFDTSDFRLWQRGLSLRHRMGESPPGAGTWTLKVPAPAGRSDRSAPTLDRTELSWPGGGDEVPPAATALLRGIVRRGQLEQITELATSRLRFVLRDAQGRSCAELDDDTVTVVGGRRDGLRFRQLEVELGDGGPAILHAVVRELRRAGAQVDDEPKLAKALGLRPGSGRTSPPPPGRTASVRHVLRTSINDALDRLLDHDLALRCDPAAPAAHAVHQARVATRRLRSDLKTFRSVLDPVWLDHTRAELAWMGEVLGNVRDADVLAGHLAEDGDGIASDDDGRLELLSRLDEQRRRARADLAQALAGDRYLDLLDRLQAGAATPPMTALPGDRPSDERARRLLPALVGRQWRVLRRRQRRPGRHPSDSELHRIRIGAKQLRYAAELATPVMGREARRLAKAAEELQTVLGDHHDAVAAEQWLSHIARTTTQAGSYVAGRLAAEQHQRQRRLRRQWRSVWDELDTKDMRRWLR